MPMVLTMSQCEWIFYDNVTDSLGACFAQHAVGESNRCIGTFRSWLAFYICIIFTLKDWSL